MKLLVTGDTIFEELKYTYEVLEKTKHMGITLIAGDTKSGASDLTGSWCRKNRREFKFSGISEIKSFDRVLYLGISDKKAKEVEKKCARLKVDFVHADLPSNIKEKLSHRNSFYLNLDPSKEGSEFINIYSRATTRLGYLLSNFTSIDDKKIPMETNHGKFLSVEGYWYWLLAEYLESSHYDDRESLRHASGFRAKSLGNLLLKNCDQIQIDEEAFRKNVAKAILYKIESSHELKGLFMKNSLPFVHYYTFSGGKPIQGAGGVG